MPLGKYQARELQASLGDLFESGKYSDLQIIDAADVVYHVHKAIICPRSAFFAAACDGKFKEASTGINKLPEDDIVAVRLMIDYMYRLDYPRVDTDGTEVPRRQSGSSGKSGSRRTKRYRNIHSSYSGGFVEDLDSQRSETAEEEVKHGPSNLTIHANVYALAEKYQVKALKALALHKFIYELDFHWDSDDFLLAAEIAYCSTIESDREMRDAVARTFDEQKSLLEKGDGQILLKAVPGLAYDLVMRRVRRGIDGACSSRWD